MKGKILWLIVSCLMILSLVLASCAPAVTEEKEVTPPPTEKEKEVLKPQTEEKEVVPKAEVPKYGGVLNVIQPTDSLTFDPGASTVSPVQSYLLGLCSEELVAGNWARGPAGTNEIKFVDDAMRFADLVGTVAESWEVPEVGTLVFHIRKGIHYAYNPASEASRLVGGRELTPDDVVFNLKRYFTSPTAYLRNTQRRLADSATITQPDERTIVIKCPKEYFISALRQILASGCHILAPEVIKKYGSMADWRNFVATGPFMLTDFVSGGVATVTRNPNYWDVDPVGPGKGNQLPYVDGVKFIVVPDLSTRLAAIRTAKVDWINNIEWEDASYLMKTTPQLQYRKFLINQPYVIGMRTDNPNLPFHDKRVRQALMMATDFETIKDDLYSGEAETLWWPVRPCDERAYVPFKELPPNVQELYTYHPDKAKQLLTEAGYPNGFTAKIICPSPAEFVDPVAVIKNMWSKVGVTLEIQTTEMGTYSSIMAGRTYNEMLLARAAVSSYVNMPNFYGTSFLNVSFVDDPHVVETYLKTIDYLIVDDAKVDELHRGLTPYLLEQAYVIPRPQPYTYIFWWPWVKNYHGEIQARGSADEGWIPWVWLDQDLKSEMRGR